MLVPLKQHVDSYMPLLLMSSRGLEHLSENIAVQDTDNWLVFAATGMTAGMVHVGAVCVLKHRMPPVQARVVGLC